MRAVIADATRRTARAEGLSSRGLQTKRGARRPCRTQGCSCPALRVRATQCLRGRTRRARHRRAGRLPRDTKRAAPRRRLEGARPCERPPCPSSARLRAASATVPCSPRERGSARPRLLARDGEEFFEREHEVLAVVYESERERDVELPRRARVEVVDGRAPVLDVEREHFANERGLTYEVALRVNTDDARCAATLQLDCVEARVATDIEHAPAREVFGQADPDLLPRRSRVLDRLAYGALGLGHNPAAQVN